MVRRLRRGFALCNAALLAAIVRAVGIHTRYAYCTATCRARRTALERATARHLPLHGAMVPERCYACRQRLL